MLSSYMKHPFSIALVAILAMFGVVLVCMFAFRTMNVAIIPPDWRNTNNDADVTDTTNDADEPSDAVQSVVSTSGNMIVTSPAANERIGLPLVVKGSARVFENTFNYRLLDADGTVLAASNAMADAFDTGEFGPFIVTTSYSAPTGTTGTLEVLDRKSVV